MKIYYVANARMPSERAHGVQLAKMCEAFLDTGADLELILPRKGCGASLEEFYGLARPVPVRRLPVIDVLSSTRFGFNVAAATFALSSFLYLAYRKMRGRAGIIYTIDLDQISFLLLPFLGMPIFFELHGAKKKRRLLAYFLQSVSGVIAVSAAVKKNIVATFDLADTRVIVQPNGIDLRVFGAHPDAASAKKELDLPSEKPIVLYVGRFYDWKGLEILPAVARTLAGEAIIGLVGDGEERFTEVTGERDLPANLQCLGYRSYREIPLWLSAADVLLVLGTQKNEYSYRETSPMKLFEYLGAGRPIIASRTPAIERIVSEREVLFCAPDNPADLSAKIRYAIVNKTVMRERAERAVRRATEYTWDERARAVLGFVSKR